MPQQTILLVDDDDDVLLILETLLANAGYAILTARDGHQGIQQAVERLPDLILLDVMMPQLSGWEVCATLKSLPETAGIPVAMLTVKSDIKDLITGMQVGADDYLTKPFTKKKLLEIVASLLARESAPSGDFLPKEAGERRAKALLIDPVCGLPTVPFVIDALRDRLLVDQEVGVLFVDVEKYAHIEDFYGWEVFDEVLRETARALRRLLGTLLSTEDLVAVNRPSGSEFCIFATLPGGIPREEAADRLQRKARLLEESLRQQLSETFQHRIHRRIGLTVGSARIRYSPQVRLERLVYRALREAVSVATSRESERAALLHEQFRDVLAHRQIRTVYQPIVELSTSRLYGYEALTRGPADSAFESPEALFEYAIKTEQVFPLERLCLGSSAARFAAARREGILFVNVETELIHELKTRGYDLLQPLLSLAGGVVLEITERAAIRDYNLFRESVSILRSLGFQIAIDDAGSGYASLQSIAELRPNFLKISNYLVTGLAHDTIKRDVVEMLVRLSVRIDARTVAEGIETEEDLSEVRRLGVHYGQGWLLGHPQPLD